MSFVKNLLNLKSPEEDEDLPLHESARDLSSHQAYGGGDDTKGSVDLAVSGHDEDCNDKQLDQMPSGLSQNQTPARDASESQHDEGEEGEDEEIARLRAKKAALQMELAFRRNTFHKEETLSREEKTQRQVDGLVERSLDRLVGEALGQATPRSSGTLSQEESCVSEAARALGAWSAMLPEIEVGPKVVTIRNTLASGPAPALARGSDSTTTAGASVSPHEVRARLAPGLTFDDLQELLVRLWGLNTKRSMELYNIVDESGTLWPGQSVVQEELGKLRRTPLLFLQTKPVVTLEYLRTHNAAVASKKRLAPWVKRATPIPKPVAPLVMLVDGRAALGCTGEDTEPADATGLATAPRNATHGGEEDSKEGWSYDAVLNNESRILRDWAFFVAVSLTYVLMAILWNPVAVVHTRTEWASKRLVEPIFSFTPGNILELDESATQNFPEKGVVTKLRFNQVDSLSQYWVFLNRVFGTFLFTEDPGHGTATVLVGAVRLRTQRVAPREPGDCLSTIELDAIASKPGLGDVARACYPRYSRGDRATEFRPSAGSSLRAPGSPALPSLPWYVLDSPFVFRENGAAGFELQSYVGEYSHYDASGYVADVQVYNSSAEEMGYPSSTDRNAAWFRFQSTLQALARPWSDQQTRLIAAEALLGGVNLPYSLVVSVLAEQSASGHVRCSMYVYSYEHSDRTRMVWLVVVDAIIAAYIAYAVWQQRLYLTAARAEVTLERRERADAAHERHDFLVDQKNLRIPHRGEVALRYLSKPWNVLELVLIALTPASLLMLNLGVFNDRANSAHDSGPGEMLSEPVVRASELQRTGLALGAFTFALFSIKLLKYMRLESHIQLFVNMLAYAAAPFSLLLAMFFAWVLAYAVFMNRIFGSTGVQGYSTLAEAFTSLIGLMLGVVDFGALEKASPVVAAIVIFTFTVGFFYFALQLFFAVFWQSYLEAEAAAVSDAKDELLGRVNAVFVGRRTLKQLVWIVCPWAKQKDVGSGEEGYAGGAPTTRRAY